MTPGLDFQVCPEPTENSQISSPSGRFVAWRDTASGIMLSQARRPCQKVSSPDEPSFLLTSSSSAILFKKTVDLGTLSRTIDTTSSSTGCISALLSEPIFSLVTCSAGSERAFFIRISAPAEIRRAGSPRRRVHDWHTTPPPTGEKRCERASTGHPQAKHRSREGAKPAASRSRSSKRTLMVRGSSPFSR